MANKVLLLAPTGFGKSTAIGEQHEHENDLDIDIKGLDPKITYVISATSKDLPWRNSRNMFPNTTWDALQKGDVLGRRISTNDGYIAAKIIRFLIPTPIQNIVIDDTNYFMQDHYMANSMKGGWDTPKKIGHIMSQIFDAVELAHSAGKNIYMMAHYEEYRKDNAGNLGFRMKTTGKATQEYITPEGKFDIMMFGKQYKEEGTNLIKKVFVTNFDGEYDGAKSPPGMFPLNIPNDLGIIEEYIKAYYGE